MNYQLLCTMQYAHTCIRIQQYVFIWMVYDPSNSGVREFSVFSRVVAVSVVVRLNLNLKFYFKISGHVGYVQPAAKLTTHKIGS